MNVYPELYSVEVLNLTAWDCKTVADFTKRQEKYKGLSFIKLLSFEEGDTYQQLASSEIVVLSKDDVFDLSLRGIDFAIKRKVDVSINITQELIRLAEKPITLVQEGGSSDTYNNKCEVHMPGQALSLYNEVLLLEDECTDELQSRIQSGWRIIAACPQPDQRRPDYIMGRFNPDLQIHGVAER